MFVPLGISSGFCDFLPRLTVLQATGDLAALNAGVSVSFAFLC